MRILKKQNQMNFATRKIFEGFNANINEIITNKDFNIFKFLFGLRNKCNNKECKEKNGECNKPLFEDFIKLYTNLHFSDFKCEDDYNDNESNLSYTCTSSSNSNSNSGSNTNNNGSNSNNN